MTLGKTGRPCEGAKGLRFCRGPELSRPSMYNRAMPKRPLVPWVAAFLFGLSFMGAGCSPPEPQRKPPTAYLVPTSRPRPTPTLTPAPLTSPLGETCEDNARFVEDLTIPDGTTVKPGTSLDKRWSVQNAGSCHWGPGYRLVRVDAGPLTGPGELDLYPARAGALAVWQVEVQAPSEPGEYLATWQARSPEGDLFGDSVFILIVVAAPTPTSTASVTETP